MNNLPLDTTLIVITGDGRFTEYLQELIPEKDNFRTVESLAEFLNQIELQASDLNTNFSPQAAKLFYSKTSIESAAHSFKVYEQLEQAYIDKIPNASKGVDYISKLPIAYSNVFGVDKNKSWNYEFRGFSIGNTTFLHKRNDRLYWATKLTLDVAYECSTNHTGLLQAISNLSSFNHKVEFMYSWSTQVKNGKLSDPKGGKLNFDTEYATHNIYDGTSFGKLMGWDSARGGMALDQTSKSSNFFSGRLDAEPITLSMAFPQQTIDGRNEENFIGSGLSYAKPKGFKHFWEKE